MVNAQTVIEPDSETGFRAKNFIQYYRALYKKLKADEVAMRHWLRRRHPRFGQSPHLMLVDEDRLVELVEYLDSTDKIND